MTVDSLALLVQAPLSSTLAAGSPGMCNPVVLGAGVSSGAIDLRLSDTPAQSAILGRYVRVVCDQDATITFGDVSVVAAVADDWPLAAGVPQDFWCGAPARGYFRARSAAAATLKWYLG